MHKRHQALADSPLVIDCYIIIEFLNALF